MVNSNKEQTNIKPKIIIRKKFSGVVVSDKSDKTVIVEVVRTKINAKYRKRYNVSKRYKVHDKDNACHVGDKVNFVECRPISKDKKWRIV